MAKFTPGPAVAAVSGSVGGTTFSRNRGGPYMRNRSIPVNPQTEPQLLRRADLATLSQNWQDLTAAQRASWKNWASQNPRIDTLGSSFTLSGQQAYISLNQRIRIQGGTLITVPPVVSAPDAFSSMSVTADIGVGSVALLFAPALAAGGRIMLFAAVTNSAGRTFVKNLYRYIAFSAANQTTPWDIQTAVELVLGTLVVGQTLHVKASPYTPANGLLAPFLTDSTAVITT